eukprot:TRINITY_DN1279_c0_g1_i1.p1 TRINITY_DN1279_c0_g1~~TRINITY_DN1279_c0_g1_i1.p1  ORF type:complete len:243 (+),score=2.17 TRINITY_DN1279_c0_g1_i1:256-984(+)
MAPAKILVGLLLSACLSVTLALPAGMGPYIAPSLTDNRGPCPAFNTMANHGVFPRDGSAIHRDKIVEAFQKYYSFAPGATKFILNGAFSSGVGDPKAGTIDLVQLRAHNKVEHDASLVRDDFALGNNYLVNVTKFNEMLSYSNGKFLTLRQLGRFHKARQQASIKNNPTFTNRESVALSEAAALAGVFGQKKRGFAIPVRWLKSFMRDQRYPDDFRKPLLPLVLPDFIALSLRLKAAGLLPF